MNDNATNDGQEKVKFKSNIFSAILGFVSHELAANDGVLMEGLEKGAVGKEGQGFAEFMKKNPGNMEIWKDLDKKW